jgi:hypothetical protein
MRFSATCDPKKVSLEELPDAVAEAVRARTVELTKLGFTSVGCFDCGTLTRETHSYVGYFCNRENSDYASLCAMVTPHTTTIYLEFSTSFTNGLTFATNTNDVMPLTPADPSHRIFRFPKIRSAQALYAIHRRLIAKYTVGWWPQGEPVGEEIRRHVRMVENYGPRHERIGYMSWNADKLCYEWTWKGACLIAWQRLWPTSIVRRLAQRHAMAVALHSVEPSGLTALKRA